MFFFVFVVPAGYFRPLFPVCVPARRFRPAFPPGVWVCATACYSRSAFPPGISLRRCLVRGAFPRSACLWGLVRFCRRFCLAALLRVSVRHFRPAFGSALPPVIPGLRSRPAFPSGGAWLAERFRAPPAFGGLVRFCLPVFCMRLLPHTAKNAPAGIRTLACSAAAPAAGTVLSNRPAAPSAAESAPYGLQSYI